MADRLLGHGTNPSSHPQSAATSALILAKEKFKLAYEIPHDLFSMDLARELNAHRDEKIQLWREAVKRVKAMTARVAEVKHPHEQVVFEVYVHEKWKTRYNSFANH